VAFTNSRSDSEIMMELNITTSNIHDLSDRIKVYDYDTCTDIEYDSTILNATSFTNDSVPDTETGNLFSAVPVKIDINTMDISNRTNSTLYPGFFNVQNDSVILQFCLKPTLGSVEVLKNGIATNSHIAYTKIKIQIKLGMSMDFTTAQVNIKEDAPSVSTEDTNVEYTLNAYECDEGTKIKIDPPSVKLQNSLVTVCIESTFNDIVVGSIKDLTLSQGTSGLTYKSINNSVPNSITEVSSTGGTKVAVSTRLVSAFFTDLAETQSTIDVTGIAVLQFRSGARKLVRIGNSAKNQRATDEILDEEEDPLGEGDFAVSVNISGNNDSHDSAASSNYVLSAAAGGVIAALLI